MLVFDRMQSTTAPVQAEATMPVSDFSKFHLPTTPFITIGAADTVQAQNIREHLADAYETFVRKGGQVDMYVDRYCAKTALKEGLKADKTVSLSGDAYSEDGAIAEAYFYTSANDSYNLSTTFIDDEYYMQTMQDFANLRDYIARTYMVDLCDIMLRCASYNTKACDCLRNICETEVGMQEVVTRIMKQSGWEEDIQRIMRASGPLLDDNDIETNTKYIDALEQVRDMRGYVFAENSIDIVALAIQSLQTKTAKKRFEQVCAEFTGLLNMFEVLFASKAKALTDLLTMQAEDIIFDF